MSIKLKGSSDGSVSFDAPADTSPSGSDITLTLPTSAGSANQFLKNSGIAGELEYSSMVENSSGNVGIGTTNPIGDLSVVASGGSGMEFQPEIATDTNRITNFNRSSSTYNNFRLDAAQQEFLISGTEKARLNSSGNLGINTSSPTSLLHVKRSSTSTSGLTDTIALQQGVATNGNRLSVTFASLDNHTVAGINGVIETHSGSASNNVGRLEFYTKASGSAAAERARISSDGYFKASNDGSYASTVSYHEFCQSNNEQMLIARVSHASYTENIIITRCSTAASSAWSFLRSQSSNGSDTEFLLRGDGNAYADGSWNGGGADYAEFFEWSDGNAKAEDRRGISVVLDGDKIREAVTGEEPIGVISGNPSVVGDADIDRWKGKYLRDDYGTYIQEDYEVEDDDGNTVVQQRRKLNPDYDPDTEYVTRENRPEWDTVGLMGKLRIRKGQVTGTRWIKMRDVSDTVEEWLVR